VPGSGFLDILIQGFFVPEAHLAAVILFAV